MTKKARLWTGVTLLAVLVFNYIIFAYPLMGKSASIEEKSRAILINQVKSGQVLKNSADEYVLEIFKREKAAIDKKLTILNALVATFAIIIASWTVFGLVFYRRK